MRVSECCAECLMNKQSLLSTDRDYLVEVRRILENRAEDDTAPYLVYLFGRAYERRFGPRRPYADVKRKYNDLVLARVGEIRHRIEASADPVGTALGYARAGNYIDFGAMNTVDDGTLFSLLDRSGLNEGDQAAYLAFLNSCKEGRNFLLLADNCGEIVLDRLLIEQLRLRFPHMRYTVMVRGGEVLNDATLEDARYAGIDGVANVVESGSAVAGTVYRMLTPEARAALDTADVILSKGQGNYETLSGSGRHVFYAFLCKCDLFTERFNVPRLTGMFVEEKQLCAV